MTIHSDVCQLCSTKDNVIPYIIPSHIIIYQIMKNHL